MKPQATSTCQTCGARIPTGLDSCPVCALLRAGSQDSEGEPEDPVSDSVHNVTETEVGLARVLRSPAPPGEGGSEARSTTRHIPAQTVRKFENYEVMLDQDGEPVELGRGAMGITYKAFDIDLRFPVTLKVISEKYVGDESARLRFLREARAAVKVRHPNVASVFHLGRSGGEYFYAMEFVEGETLETLIKRSSRIKVKLAGDLTAAGGLEYRSESLVQSNDVNSRNVNIGAGDFSGKLFSAARWVQSMYGELSISIFGDRWSWPGLRDLQVILDERLDNYSRFGSAAKPKVAILYKPLDDIAIRLTYSEGYIVPTLGQLFEATGILPNTVFDPVKGVFSNIGLRVGANPNLRPENSYGYYGEIVWTPGSKDENSWWHWAKGLTAYLDWYQVELRQLIGTTSIANTILANLPGTVIRAPNGQLVEVNTTFQNLGTLLTDGIQFGASYVTKEYSWGKLELDANGAYVYNYALKQIEGLPPHGEFHNPNAPQVGAEFIVIDLTDTAGNTGPDFKIVASLFYSKHLFGNDLFRTGFTLNYQSSELDVFNDGHGTVPEIDARLTPNGYIHLIGDWTTVDWQISYEFGPPVEVTPETPKPGYDKEGKRSLEKKRLRLLSKVMVGLGGACWIRRRLPSVLRTSSIPVHLWPFMAMVATKVTTR